MVRAGGQTPAVGGSLAPESSAQPLPLPRRGTWTLPAQVGHGASLCHLAVRQSWPLLHRQMAGLDRGSDVVLSVLSHPTEVTR